MQQLVSVLSFKTYAYILDTVCRLEKVTEMKKLQKSISRHNIWVSHQTELLTKN